jgi:hypothetical protein
VPFCHKGTIGPGATSDTSAKSGTACHIYSAAKNGPRGTGGLTAEQRQGSDNAIWCCATHGRLIDTNKGGRYPAELLKHWKKLHEAWIDRETAGFETHLGWVNQLEILNSVLFEASACLRLSKATLIQGESATGKSSICEWLAGISQTRPLRRWRKYEHDLKLEYFAPDLQTILLTLHNGDIQRSRNGKKLIEGPQNFSVIHLPEDHARKFRKEQEADDLIWLATVLNAQPETIRMLCEDIRVNGHPFCRHMEFREEHVELNEEEDEPGRDGWFLYVSVDTKASHKLPLGSLATSEEIVVMVQLASALARVQAQHTPTLLARLSHLEGLFDYFRLETGVKLNGCNGGISEPVAVKTYPL